MIRWFKRWLDLRKARKSNKHYDEGYSYAAGILLKFKGTINLPGTSSTKTKTISIVEYWTQNANLRT